mgnify:CR=1 FL=1
MDPWVQSVSINTGIQSNYHKMFNLGQKIPKKLNQIWDILSKRKFDCAVWGVMNSSYNNNKHIKIFFPDPWNNKAKLKPDNLRNIFKLPMIYAQNYTDFKIFKNIKSILQFLISCFKLGIFTYFLNNIFFYLRLFITTGFKNYFLFFLFDIVSINIFKKLTKNNCPNFSLIFFNSLAHFQHNNWDEKKNYYKYFLLTEEIFKSINKLSAKYDNTMIYNGFTQKLIKPEFIIRPKNPENFLKGIGLKFKNFNSDMTNGGIINFNNVAQKQKSLKILKEANIYGYKLFKIIHLNSTSIFFTIQIKSFTNFNSSSVLVNNKIKDQIFYDKNGMYLKKKHLKRREILKLAKQNKAYCFKKTPTSSNSL